MTYDEAHALFNYDPDTGSITWKHNAGRWGRIPAGSKATSIDSKGYAYVHVYDKRTKKCKNIRAHRLAWLLSYGEYPDADIDHVNRIRTDNRLANLRKATRSEQVQNQTIRSDNTSGVTGVSKTRNGTFATSLWVQGKKHYIGTFKTIEEAENAYRTKKKELHSF